MSKMKVTTEGTIIGGKCHALYSPQRGTLCGIKKWCNREDIIQINDLDDITCEACKREILNTVSILYNSTMKY